MAVNDYKYAIQYSRSGLCGFMERETNSLMQAMWWLLKLSIKFPIITFEIRRGYIRCIECDADWCKKSKAYRLEHLGE